MKKPLIILIYSLISFCAFSQELSHIEQDYLFSDSLANAGDFESAIIPAEGALQSAENAVDIDPAYIMMLKQNLARILFYLKDYSSAAPLLKENVLFAEDEEGLRSEIYASNLRELAICLDSLGNSVDLEFLCNKRLKYLEDSHNSLSLEYLLYCMDLSDLYLDAARFEDAIALNLKAYKTEKVLAESNPLLGDKSPANLAWLYLITKDVESAVPWLKLMNSSQYEMLSLAIEADDETKSLAISTLRENESWMQSYNHASNYSYPALNEITLNNQLVLKGLELSNAKSKISHLRDLQDSRIDSLIADLFKSRQEFENVFDDLLLENDEALKTVLDSLNIELKKKNAVINELYNHHFGTGYEFKRNWRDVQARLSQDEIAIDFSSFYYSQYYDDYEGTIYVASIISPNYSSPQTIYLFDEIELDDLLSMGNPNRLYASRGAYDTDESFDEEISSALFKLIWKPILNEVGDVKRIYFSPAGILNKVSMSALEDEKGNAIVEKLDLIQLLNTNTITELIREPKKGPSVLVGGINYDIDPEVKSTENVDSIIINNVWKYLPGTLQEVNKISELYIATHADVTQVSGDDATEEWFRLICKNGGPGVLHLATHGFSFTEEEAWEIALEGVENDWHVPNLGTKPMERTGLLLAHANVAWANNLNELEQEDGILTADEIAKLDLQNTDLVVLSACETGLGEVKGTEGVYGLQRAFRLAGAKYMILSLWQVPDLETSEFMQSFYGHWLGGNPLREAFNKTQREMSAKYKSEPKKWAAFVLIQ